ncbi:MAG TPA: DUF4831 family protein [Candidatus Methylacidiphilales bacterium]|nr:DUF4831 family protein [Candidatus Methylacidiphilales bacterium]
MGVRPSIGLSSVVAVLLLSGCASTTVVTPLASVTDTGRGGVVYTLPQTAIDVKITVTKATQKPGKYVNDADTIGLLAGTKIIKTESVTFKCGGSQTGDVTMTPVGVGDPSKAYFAAIAGGPFADNSMTLTFNNNGTLSTSLSEQENKASDFVVGTLELGAKVAGSAISFASLTVTAPATPDKVEKAEADQISNLLTTRKQVVENVSSPDPAFDSRLKEIDAELKPLLSDFVGTTQTETWTAVFRVIPGAGVKDVPIFTYSEDTGIDNFAVNPQTTCPFPLKAAPAGKGKLIHLVISLTPRVDKGLAAKLGGQGEHGYYYNVPADGHVTLQDGNKILLPTDTQFGQDGTVAFLPASVGSRKAHVEVTLDGVSGALTKVVVNSTAYDPSQIAGIGTAASGLIDATNPATALSRKAAEDKAKFESLQYQRQLQELQNQSGPLPTTLQ